METIVHLDNKTGYVCYGCNSQVTVDLFQFTSLNSPNNWLCSTCLATRITNSTLVITDNTIGGNNDGNDNELTCYSCGDNIDAFAKSNAEAVYCESCHDQQYESGQEDANSTCNYCGDDSEVYCRDHAKTEFDLHDEDDFECDECGVGATTEKPLRNLCEACFAQVTTEAVSVAQAAEPIEVSWDG